MTKHITFTISINGNIHSMRFTDEQAAKRFALFNGEKDTNAIIRVWTLDEHDGLISSEIVQNGVGGGF